DPGLWQRVLAQRRQEMPLRYRDLQPFPKSEIDAVLTAFAGVRAAFRSGTIDRFDDAARVFFRAVADTTDGTTILGLAQRLNTKEVNEAAAKVSEARQADADERIRQAMNDFFETAAAAGETTRPYPGALTIRW